MIPKITASTIYSTLGNNSSKVPLAIKDIANSCGLTAASYMSGDNVEGKDRFIDEFGTQAIWLWGIPAYQKVLDLTLFKTAGFDPKIDSRILKDANIFKAAQELAPTEAIKNSLAKISLNQGKFKTLSLVKFAASTILTSVTYLGLTKYRHKYTEDQIKKDYYEKQKHKHVSFMDKSSQKVPFSAAFSQVHPGNKKNDKSVSFTGGLQDFVFDPVKNLMIVDASITGERLTHARNPQDFLGYVIKEGSFWIFMYFAGPLIAKAMEKSADKKGTSIDLDARVIESEKFKNAFKDGSIKSHLQAFKAADKSDLDIYKFAVQSKDNLIIDMAKNSDVISILKGTDSVDTRRYIDLKELRGVSEKIEKLLGQYENSGKDLDEFFKAVRKLKRASVIKNMGACIGALGIVAPAIMLLMRKFSPEYQVKKDLEAKLARMDAQNIK